MLIQPYNLDERVRVVAPVESLELRVEVVCERDPDAGTRVHVFINGVAVDAEEYHVDPGSGIERESWNEHRADSLKSASPACAEALKILFDIHDRHIPD